MELLEEVFKALKKNTANQSRNHVKNDYRPNVGRLQYFSNTVNTHMQIIFTAFFQLSLG